MVIERSERFREIPSAKATTRSVGKLAIPKRPGFHPSVHPSVHPSSLGHHTTDPITNNQSPEIIHQQRIAHVPFLTARDGGRRPRAPIPNMIDHGKVLAHVCVDDGVDDQLSGQLALFCAHVPEDVGIGVPDGFDGKRQLGVNAQEGRD